MTKSPFQSLAFVAALGATPIAIFVGTLADAATPVRAQSTHSVFYLSTGLATAAFGFDKELNIPAVDIGLADIDPRLIKSKDVDYVLVDRADAIAMIQEMRNVIGRADKDTVLVDDAGYAVAMLDSDDLRADAAYAELLDEPIDENTVLILVIGPAAAQTLRGLDIDPDKLVIGDDASDVLAVFTEYTLGITDEPDSTDDDMPGPGTGTSPTLGAKPALADA
jgi:hypothetical protein